MIRILFAAANPVDTDPLGLGREMREIEAKLRAAEERSSFEVRSVWAVRADDLLQQMNQFRPNILHISGHGAPTGEIVLETAEGLSQPVPTAGLQALFANFGRWLQIVVLNACYSERQADGLLESTDIVIGMNETIGDWAAILFAASFYRALAFGHSVQDAFAQGRTSLLLEGIDEDDTPVLLSRRGVDASALTLVGRGSVAAAMLRSRDPAVPERLRALLETGAELVVLDSPTSAGAARDESRLAFIELALRHSPTTFVLEVDRDAKIEIVARRVAARLLVNLDTDEYDWTLVHGDDQLEGFLTLTMAGVRSGDTVLLVGNHRRPEWRPQIAVD